MNFQNITKINQRARSSSFKHFAQAFLFLRIQMQKLDFRCLLFLVLFFVFAAKLSRLTKDSVFESGELEINLKTVEQRKQRRTVSVPRK